MYKIFKIGILIIMLVGCISANLGSPLAAKLNKMDGNGSLGIVVNGSSGNMSNHI